MKYIFIGKLVNTHGIKGEVRIRSNFKFKSDVFKKDFSLYIGNEKNKEVINTYRPHKTFDMVTFLGINNINEVLKYKGENVYILKEDLEISGYLNEDIIGFEVFISNKNIGILDKIEETKAHEIFIVGSNMIPNVPAFIKKIDIENKKIEINEIEGLIDEN